MKQGEDPAGGVLAGDDNVAAEDLAAAAAELDFTNGARNARCKDFEAKTWAAGGGANNSRGANEIELVDPTDADHDCSASLHQALHQFDVTKDGTYTKNAKPFIASTSVEVRNCGPSCETSSSCFCCC